VVESGENATKLTQPITEKEKRLSPNVFTEPNGPWVLEASV
jgi:hypothetical protein